MNRTRVCVIAASRSAEQLTQLYEQLEREFGGRGRRAAEFLQQAETQLRRAIDEPAPRDGETVGYCLREALAAIQQAVGGYDHRFADGDRLLFGEVSRDVVTAGKPLQEGSRDPVDLSRLLDAITRLESFHAQSTVREDQLTRLMLIRSGVPPVTAQGSAIESFNRVGSRVSEGLHSELTLSEATDLHQQALEALLTLFHPPSVRLERLERLAQVDQPGDEERSQLQRLVATPHHLRHFFGHVRSAAWLRLLDGTWMVELPEQPGAPWPVVSFLEQHAADDEPTIRGWLRKVAANVRDSHHLDYLAVTARRLGRNGDPALLELVRRHPTHLGVQHHVRARFLAAPAQEDVVTRLGDYVLDPSGGSEAWMDRIVRHYLAGVDDENGAERLKILTFKLKAWLREEGPLALGPMRGSVAHRLGRSDPRRALLHAWTQVVESVVAELELDDLVELADRLPPEVGLRLQAYLLARFAAPDDPDRLVVAVAEQLQQLSPGPDEALLVDRALQVAERSTTETRWRAAVGTPPSLDAVRAQFRTDVSMTDRLLRMAWWSTVLPEEVFHGWSEHLDHVRDQVGRIDRASLERPPSRPRVGPWRSTSPLSTEQIAEMEPLEAAAAIGGWVPPTDPSSREDPGELGYALQQAVEADPEPWLQSASEAMRRLDHPMYVRYLIMGLARSDLDAVTHAERLAAVAVEVMARQGYAEPMGVGRDGDSDWTWAVDTAVELVAHLADAGVELGRARGAVWSRLRDLADPASAADDEAHAGDGREPLDTATSMPATRALDAAMRLAWAEASRGQPVEPRLIELLDRVVELNGPDAHPWRAMLASHLDALSTYTTLWLERRGEELFGDAADPELRRVGVDTALRYSRRGGPRWLETNFSAAVDDALQRGAWDAMRLLLARMFSRDPDAKPAVVVARILRHNPALLSDAPVAVLPDEEHTGGDLDVVLDFWSAAVDAAPPDALYGFGWFAELRGLPDQQWADRMLATARAAAGDLDHTHAIAERCLEIGATPQFLQLLLLTLRGTSREHERYDIALAAAALLGAGSAEAGLAEHRHRLRDAVLEYGFGKLLEQHA